MPFHLLCSDHAVGKRNYIATPFDDSLTADNPTSLQHKHEVLRTRLLRVYNVRLVSNQAHLLHVNMLNVAAP